MASTLPSLRQVLDVLPSPDKNRPGLILRDPFRYSEAIIYVPPLWALALRYLDGGHSELELQEVLVRATGELVFSHQVQDFVGILREQGFLETEEFYRLRERRHQAFRDGFERPAIHAGTAYPADPSDAHKTLDDYFSAVDAAGLSSDAVGVAAPHVSLEGGRNCYAMTYRRLASSPRLADRTFVVLGTSHWGAPDKFGLTSKPYSTPLGSLRVDTELVAWLQQHGGEAVASEDYCHTIEHSIEFQCLFLQHALGKELKMIPILCGPFVEGPRTGGAPEKSDAVRRFFEALRELAEEYGDRLFWVLGIDLAHVGRRYGDDFNATASQGRMAEVAQQDRRRLEWVCAGDSQGFLESVGANGDELKWCGYSALYTFMKAVGRARGRLLGYEQWNIDPQSVVSFASLEFFDS